MSKRSLTLLLGGLLLLPPAAKASPPEFAFVVGEEQRINIFVPAFQPYTFNYDTVHLEILDGPGGSVIPSGTTLPAPGLPGDIDGDDDFDLSDFLAFQACVGSSDPNCHVFDFDLSATVDAADFVTMTWYTGPGIPGDGEPDFDFDMHDVATLQRAMGEPAATCPHLDLNGDGVIDVADFQGIQFTGPTNPLLDLTVPTQVWVRGKARSATLNDAFIAATSDPGYGWAATATVFELAVTAPPFLSLGDVITLELLPSGGGFGFDAGTTAAFSDPGVPLSITWEAADVIVCSPSQAVIIAGTGVTSASSGVFLNPLSSLTGSLSVDLRDVLLGADVSLSLAAPSTNFYRIAYSIAGTPALGDPVPANEPLLVAFNDLGSPPGEDDLLDATAHHYCIVVPVMQNSYTQALPEMTVQVVTFDASGSVVDEFPVTLVPDNPGASPILFISDILVPLIPLDVYVDRTGYTHTLPFGTAHSGAAAILPLEVMP